jgi:DHA2 family multidrug resistance protein
VTFLAVLGCAGTIGLIWHELRTKEPVINFRILKSRQVTAGVTIGLVLGFALYGSVFVLPVFLQNVLNMTAWQTGRVMLPGALAAAVTMAIVGRTSHMFDARHMVVLGTLLYFLSMWQMSQATAASGLSDFFWPLIWRGVGLGCIFVPLTNATLVDLSYKDLAQGTGMFNLFRQLGGSLGIAIMATWLSHLRAVERSYVVEHVLRGSAATTERISMFAHGFIAKGYDPLTAHQAATSLLDKQIDLQASVLAFSKIYLYSGVILMASLPLLFLFRTGDVTQAPPIETH